jgi:multicomponent Na+:H+ antiporter subunit E
VSWTRFWWALVRFALTAITLFLGWLLFTWSFAPNSVLLGVIFSGLVSLATYHLYIDESEAAWRALLPRLHWLIVYLGVLIFSMYVASFQVLWQIIRGKINPGVVHFRTRLRSDIARVALSAGITLTPGTITIDLDEDHLVVHWLDASTRHSRHAGELIKGTYEKLMRRIWV